MTYFYVYILESIQFPDKRYIGFTSNLPQRLAKHNESRSIYTSKFKPWKIKNEFEFTDRYKALAFEKYLKSHSEELLLKSIFKT